LKIEFDLM